VENAFLLNYGYLMTRGATERALAVMRQNSVVHIVLVVAICVLLVLAVALTAAAIILCARERGTLEFMTILNPFQVKVGCKR
jgi:hypothetical protein